MNFLIPQQEGLTDYDIKEEFFSRYYPEMTASEGSWSIFGDYVMLQKNPFVCAKMWIKQKDKEGKTQIRIEKDVTFWVRLIGAPIYITPFIQGDFYDDLYRNFCDWLTKKYDISKDEIIMTKPWERTARVINSLILAAVLVGIIFLVQKQLFGWNWFDNPNLWQWYLMHYYEFTWIVLFPVAFLEFLYYINRKEKQYYKKLELKTGVKVRPFMLSKIKNITFLNFFLFVMACGCLFLLALCGLENTGICVMLLLLLAIPIIDFSLIAIWLLRFKKTLYSILAYIHIAILVSLVVYTSVCLLYEYDYIEIPDFDIGMSFIIFFIIVGISLIAILFDICIHAKEKKIAKSVQ